MKNILLLVFVGAVASAAPQQSQSDVVPILKYDSDINQDGSYRYSFETGDGIKAEQKGYLKNVGAEEPALQVEGQFQYPSDGGEVQLTYIADENGFQPQGAHLPTAPPIPEAIQRALAYLATAPPQPENKKR